MLPEALDHLVRGIVNNPDDVVVSARQQRGRNPRFAGRGETLEVRVHPDDLGRVIGRSGRTATALRTVLQALSDQDNIRIDIVDVDRRR
ncbi:MAG: RNA-binding protein [Nocardioidaceae bacterium]|nr:RNA-binding protein [Nocardioidaceae bacterium]